MDCNKTEREALVPENVAVVMFGGRGCGVRRRPAPLVRVADDLFGGVQLIVVVAAERVLEPFH